ncbi:MAG: metallophosphoesterase [Gammaproteobacteria bacterium]|nr:metallophosphoesterase [Gammaproteobacteria bacterium]MCW8922673.1 metallophosphoesterase [Gammaproteobacteria bacterium]
MTFKFPAKFSLLPFTLLFLVSVAYAQPSSWTDIDRIVAVGDVHGDYDQFVKTLRAANVINTNNKWIGGKTHLVQIGDILDRGPDSRKVMDLLMELETQALVAGGYIHALIGNHEAMVKYQDLHYAHPMER